MRRLIWEYVRSVYFNWRGFCLGMVPFLVVFIAAQIKVDGRTLAVPMWLWVALGLFGILVAQFLTWRGEREKRERADQERDKARADLKNIIEAQIVGFEGVNTKTFMNPDEPEHSMIAPTVRLHNYGASVVRFEIVSMHVVLDGRTIADPPTAPGVGTIMPDADVEFGPGQIRDVDIRKPFMEGRLDMAIRYGPPGVAPTRELTVSTHLHMLQREPSEVLNYCEYAGLETRDELIPQDA